jgi:hypothetical protein
MTNNNFVRSLAGKELTTVQTEFTRRRADRAFWSMFAGSICVCRHRFFDVVEIITLIVRPKTN